MGCVYYKQKPLSQSASKSVYENIQQNKNLLKFNFTSQLSYYTMLGVIHVDGDKEDDLIDFLKTFETKEQKEKVMVGVDNLFEDLSKEAGYDISAAFLGLGIDLDCIFYDIEKYREYMKNNRVKTLRFEKY